jgi:hypothetical protein
LHYLCQALVWHHSSRRVAETEQCLHSVSVRFCGEDQATMANRQATLLRSRAQGAAMIHADAVAAATAAASLHGRTCLTGLQNRLVA